MPDSSSADPDDQTPPASACVTATDHAILAAFCAPYVAGQRFCSPAPNNRILEELASNDIYLDLDTLRTHLRNLYAKFGVEEGLTPAQKRVRLAELVYDQGVIPGWNTSGPITSSASVEADTTSAAPSPVEGETPGRFHAAIRRLRIPRHRRWMAAAMATVVISLSLTAAKPWSLMQGSDEASDQAIRRGSISDTTATVDGAYVLVRPGPARSFASMTRLTQGTRVSIVCQTRGEPLDGPRAANWPWWNKLATPVAGWVSDAFIDSGSQTRAARDCRPDELPRRGRTSAARE